jgi:hypothetical protein
MEFPASLVNKRAFARLTLTLIPTSSPHSPLASPPQRPHSKPKPYWRRLNGVIALCTDTAVGWLLGTWSSPIPNIVETLMGVRGGRT